MANENQRQQIEGKKCRKCGFLQHTSHIRCLNCKHDQFDIIESSEECTLLTYTILKAPPAEFRKEPSYALGIVEFSNGIRALGQLTEQNNLTLGMKLKPIYKKVSDNLDGKEIYDFVFAPV